MTPQPKRLALFLKAIGIALGLLLSQTAIPAGAAAQQEVAAGTSHHIRSAVLGEEREYTVRLPDSYRWRPDKRYPTLYLLDGKAHFLHTAGTVSHLSSAEDIPEMIIVAVASTVRVRDFT